MARVKKHRLCSQTGFQEEEKKKRKTAIKGRRKSSDAGERGGSVAYNLGMRARQTIHKLHQPDHKLAAVAVVCDSDCGIATEKRNEQTLRAEDIQVLPLKVH